MNTKTSSTPVLLTTEQHDMVKNRLAELLKNQYGIINQRDGKLEFMAAYLMGYTNHQQRKKIYSETLAENANTSEVHPKRSTFLWPVFPQTEQPENHPIGTVLYHAFLCSKDPSKLDVLPHIQERGWFTWNDVSDYIDLEFEVVDHDQPHAKQNNYHSIGLRLSLNLTDMTPALVIGNNLGDGFNELQSLDLSSSYEDLLKILQPSNGRFSLASNHQNRAHSAFENCSTDSLNILLREITFLWTVCHPQWQTYLSYLNPCGWERDPFIDFNIDSPRLVNSITPTFKHGITIDEDVTIDLSLSFFGPTFEVGSADDHAIELMIGINHGDGMDHDHAYRCTLPSPFSTNDILTAITKNPEYQKFSLKTFSELHKLLVELDCFI